MATVPSCDPESITVTSNAKSVFWARSLSSARSNSAPPLSVGMTTEASGAFMARSASRLGLADQALGELHRIEDAVVAVVIVVLTEAAQRDQPGALESLDGAASLLLELPVEQQVRVLVLREGARAHRALAEQATLRELALQPIEIVLVDVEIASVRDLGQHRGAVGGRIVRAVVRETGDAVGGTLLGERQVEPGVRLRLIARQAEQ